MKKYTTLFFDVDNTLLDFSASEAFAIRQLFKNYSLPSDDKTIAIYSAINNGYWKKLERGELPREVVLVSRFADTLSVLNEKRDAAQMNNDYFGLLSACHFVKPDAENVLAALKERGYVICATSNGIALTQIRRIKESGLSRYLDYTFVSEEVGFAKPKKEYFDFVFSKIKEKDKSKILLIGDSMTSDIKGGKNAGIDTCWFDGYGEEKLYEPDYTVTDLKEILNIL